MSRRYAKGRHAVAECQRSGQKMKYRDLVEDGHIPGLLVHPDWWEPKHPQETPPDMTDPIALHRPAPEISIEADYGNPEAPTPIPAEPALSDPNTTIFVSMTAGDTQVVLDEALTYYIGLYVFIELDGGGWFVSLIRSTADSPSITVPFTTPFSGVATAGNQVYISEGFFPLPIAQKNFDVTVGNYLNNTFSYVGYHIQPSDDGHLPTGPNPHVSSITNVDENGFYSIVGDNGIPIAIEGVFQLAQFIFIVEFYIPPVYAGARILFETYSRIELDHDLGTQILLTSDIGSGGDMDQGSSTDSDNGAGGLQFVFPFLSEGKSTIWFDSDVGNTYTIRFIP